MSLPIPEPIARALMAVPVAIIKGVVELIGRIARSKDPAGTLARALQVTAHEEGADATIDAMFAAKRAAKKKR